MFTFEQNLLMEVNNKYSRGEELANWISHLVGAILAVAALVLLVSNSKANGNGWHVATSSIFGTAMIVLYLSSTLTHILPMGKAKNLFFNLDRIAIYFLIAGTYTPIALIALRGVLGWVIFSIEWGFAISGAILILLRPGKFKSGVNTYYVVSYALMGWLIMIAVVPMLHRLPIMGNLWDTYRWIIIFHRYRLL